jgi:hypothetical protein
LLRFRKLPDALFRPLLGFRQLPDDTPQLGEVMRRHELVVHFDVQIGDQFGLIGRKRPLQPVSDFRETDHVEALLSASTLKYRP